MFGNDCLTDIRLKSLSNDKMITSNELPFIKGCEKQGNKYLKVTTDFLVRQTRSTIIERLYSLLKKQEINEYLFTVLGYFSTCAMDFCEQNSLSF